MVTIQGWVLIWVDRHSWLNYALYIYIPWRGVYDCESQYDVISVTVLQEPKDKHDTYWGVRVDRDRVRVRDTDTTSLSMFAPWLSLRISQSFIIPVVTKQNFQKSRPMTSEQAGQGLWRGFVHRESCIIHVIQNRQGGRDRERSHRGQRRLIEWHKVT